MNNTLLVEFGQNLKFFTDPTPVYAFKILLVESTTGIHKQNEADLIGTPIFQNKIDQISG